MNEVEYFWNKRVVGNAKKCKTKAHLEDRIAQRFNLYPGYPALMGLYDSFQGKTVLDYGCGPAWDLCWIALTDKPSKLVGVDISKRSFDIAKHHLMLAGVKYPFLFRVHEDSFLDIGKFDIIFSSGVIHHVTDPYSTLEYLKSLMHDKTELRVMVYNKNSILNRVLVPEWGGKFEDYVDGGKCPIARCYSIAEFQDLCHSAGLVAIYKGSYFDPREQEFSGKYEELGGLGGVYYITKGAEREQVK